MSESEPNEEYRGHPDLEPMYRKLKDAEQDFVEVSRMIGRALGQEVDDDEE